MNMRNTPIRRKLMLIILLTSAVVMLLMGGTFIIQEYVTFRRATSRQLSTLGGIVAANSTAALAFQNPADAEEILSALAIEPHIVGAGLYDRNGTLFAQYPTALPAGDLPLKPGPAGYRFEGSDLSGYQPVMQGGRQLGVLYLKFDMAPIMSAWLRDSLGTALAVMSVILLVAYVLSRKLQQQISQPILAPAGTAQSIAEHRDYSVRAPKLAGGELGLLTDAFNQMLAQIQERNLTLRESEARLQTIIEHLDEGLAVSDLDGKVLHYNRAALEMHGFKNLDECRRHLDEFAAIFELSTRSGTVLSVDQRPLARVLRGETVRNLELDIRDRRTGWRKIFNYGGTLVRDGAGRPTMAVVTISNITERERAAEEIRTLNQDLERRVAERTVQFEAANRQLQTTNRELEAFSYSVSHDLRAPLRHVDGFAGLLQKHAATTLDEKGHRYLTTISGAARQMGRLIDDLLAFSRINRSDLRTADLDHDALVALVIREGRFDSRDRPLDWSVSPLPRVRADAAMLRQVWFNLIDNAVKYSGKSARPRIEIGSRTDAVTGELVFFVRDNGVGFDMNYVDKLFGVFQRLHGPAEFEGTGIGLANVHRIITRHGGRTWAEGRVGEGATFYFSLPALGHADGPVAAPAGGSPSPSTAGSPPGSTLVTPSSST